MESKIATQIGYEMVQNLRLKKNETSNPKRDEFNKFMENAKFSLKASSRPFVFSGLLSSLKTKTQTIYELDQLSEVFESLLRRAETDRCHEKLNWSELETNFLISIIAYYCLFSVEDFRSLSDKDWQYIEAVFPTKQVCQIIKQWNCILKVNVKQYPWTLEEDRELTRLVAEFGAQRNWKIIAEKMDASSGNGIMRGMRQCRERWMNHIDPKINKGDWSEEEDCKLMKSFLSLGKKWSEIAKILGNRTDNAVKNRWSSLIKKESSQKNTLDENLSRSNESFEKKIANRIIDKITLDCHKKEKRVQKPSVKTTAATQTNNLSLPSMFRDSLKIESGVQSINSLKSLALSDCKTAEMTNKLNLFSGNQNYCFRVQNPISSQIFVKEFVKTEPQIFFAVVDMNMNRIQILEKVFKNNL